MLRTGKASTAGASNEAAKTSSIVLLRAISERDAQESGVELYKTD